MRILFISSAVLIDAAIVNLLRYIDKVCWGETVPGRGGHILPHPIYK
jgi:hypothetical protein